MATRSSFLISFSLTIGLLIVNSHSFTTLKAGEVLQFTYSGAKGPDRWATLNPKFFLCENGTSQSPINVATDQAILDKNLKPLVRDYRTGNVTLVDYKFTVGIEYPDETGGIIFDDKEYKLKQMHWHSPSEHRIDGQRYAAELHMVHVADDGNILVVATLFSYGHPDPILGKIEKKLNELAYNNVGSRMSIGVFDPRELRKSPRKYYKYIGSFSAPPCTENITYLILGKARSISRQQVDALKAPLDMDCKYNARPCQPINDRHVDLFDESTIVH